MLKSLQLATSAVAEDGTRLIAASRPHSAAYLRTAGSAQCDAFGVYNLTRYDTV